MEKKNYSLRVGDMKITAWDTVDQNGNRYFSYQLVRSIKQKDGTYKDYSIPLDAMRMAATMQLFDRMLATIALRPISFVTQDNSQPPADVPSHDDIPY